ncbi:uncharacterized protein [Rutidosis leptorrhynchoides]|uniref:uncharacterized protein n=1 Tax=Rutidosis leptorrhynchoides TaxID=125765 RepID=UPI003A9A3DA7
MSRLQMFRLKSLWGNVNFDYAVSLARGFSGGIISLWDCNSFWKSDIWCNDNFVIVKGTWLRENVEVFMVNVYAPQVLSDKIVLWNNLTLFMASHLGNYIFMGDWNSVRCREDRCGSDYCPRDSQVFNDFIESNALYDIPLGGLRFTYRNKAGNKLIKLDRFFITNNLFNVVNDLKGSVLDRGYSDHSPIFLFQDKVDFGPTYFKIFDSWFDRTDFDVTLRNAWNLINVNHDTDICAKFRLLKANLRSWIQTSRSSEKVRINMINQQLHDLDFLIDAGNANADVIDRRNCLFTERDELLKFKDLDSLQKSRLKWDVEGDENSKFFHCSIKHKRGVQKIQGLMIDGVWEVEPGIIKKKFCDFFKDNFDDHSSGATFIHVDPNYKLSVEEANFLEREVDDAKIKDAVWDWDILQFDICRDIRRLLPFIDKLISPVQSAFIAGRQILDGPMMVSEIITWFKKVNKKMLLFKVDFEKAYDSVNWDYLIFMLASLGFGSKWCDWIMGCLKSARTSVLVNGSPTREFELKRGLRQGDLLSPFLFIIVMEGLNLALNRAKEANFSRGIYVGSNNIHISHLFYADDVVILSYWNIHVLNRILLILEVFYLASGLRINVNKSHIFGICVDIDEVNSFALSSGARAGTFPTKYLGIPIGANMKLCKNWDPLVEKFRSKLASWKASLISSGGRLPLIKSVMGSLGIYFMSMFKCPEKVLKLLKSIRTRFFWGGNNSIKKTSWVKWDKILAPFERGGLNVGSLKAFNIALILKWRWHFLSKPNDLWVNIVKSIHGSEFASSSGSRVSVWSNVVEVCKWTVDNGYIPNNAFRMLVDSGANVQFWHDPWCGVVPLASKFNRLFHLEVYKECSVADKWKNGSWNWTWSRDLIGSRNEQLLNELIVDISGCTLNDGDDRWDFSVASKGLFNVKEARLYLDRKLLPSTSPITSWFKFIPRKVNIFLWRFRLNALPVRWKLFEKGIDINSIVCPICNNGIETRDHVFFDYPLSLDIWQRIRIWFNCSMPSFSSWDTFIEWIEGIRLCVSSKHRVIASVITTLWAIWRFRNGIVEGVRAFHHFYSAKLSVEGLENLRSNKEALAKQMAKRFESDALLFLNGKNYKNRISSNKDNKEVSFSKKNEKDESSRMARPVARATFFRCPVAGWLYVMWAGCMTSRMAGSMVP